MRILHIIDSLGLGGAQVVVKGIFEKQKNNNNIFLCALRAKKKQLNIVHDNSKVLSSTLKFSLKGLVELRKMVKKEKIEVLHCHLFKSQIFGFILKCIFFPKIKLIMHEHGRILNGKFYYKFFILISKRNTNLFIAVSKAIGQKLVERAKVPTKKIKLLYNFVDLDLYKKENIKWDVVKEKVKMGLKKDDFIIGFAGRLIEMKGWRTFIEAIDILHPRCDCRFIIAGDGEEKKQLIEMINRKGLQNIVLYLGHISDMVWFYSLLDTFVVASRWEAMGLTNIEAQTMGVPVIVSNVPALNEIIKDNENGLLFTLDNKKDLADKIEKIYSDKKLRNKLIKNGLESVKNYDLEEYNEKLEQIYLSL